MKNRVQSVRKIFKVDNKNRVVICELHCDMNQQRSIAYFSLHPNMWKKKFPNVDCCGKYIVKAVARCSPNDIFNEELGKMIAESRAKVQMFSVAEGVWKCCKEVLNRYLDECSNKAHNCRDAKFAERYHVDDLLELDKSVN